MFVSPTTEAVLQSATISPSKGLKSRRYLTDSFFGSALHDSTLETSFATSPDASTNTFQCDRERWFEHQQVRIAQTRKSFTPPRESRAERAEYGHHRHARARDWLYPPVWTAVMPRRA